jgi:hypothetical protein
MRIILLSGLLWLQACLASGEVRIWVQETNGLASVQYQCLAGEVVRSFALDVTIDHGVIRSVTNYFRGLSTAAAQGYGVFPGSFRDTITVNSGTNADWSASAYSPVAVTADSLGATLPGLNSSGVTLELAAIWDPTIAGATPPSSGTLCALELSQPANVTLAANLARGGIVGAPSDLIITPQFYGALVGPAISGTTFLNGVMTINFQGGELETAPAVDGPWAGTANTTGTYSETLGQNPAGFYRVRRH